MDLALVFYDNNTIWMTNLPDSDHWYLTVLASIASAGFSYATAALLPGRRRRSTAIVLVTGLVVLSLGAAANLAVLYGTSSIVEDEQRFWIGAGVCLVLAVACAWLGGFPARPSRAEEDWHVFSGRSGA